MVRELIYVFVNLYVVRDFKRDSCKNAHSLSKMGLEKLSY